MVVACILISFGDEGCEKWDLLVVKKEFVPDEFIITFLLTVPVDSGGVYANYNGVVAHACGRFNMSQYDTTIINH